MIRSDDKYRVAQRYCDEISDLLKVFLPGCVDVQKILFARVPIIKYHQVLSNNIINNDLSESVPSGKFKGVNMYFQKILSVRELNCL